jgi:hypothetical protein
VLGGAANLDELLSWWHGGDGSLLGSDRCRK